MNSLSDRLLRLTMINSSAQIYMKTREIFLEEFVMILRQTNDEKFCSTLIRFLPLLSSNANTKSTLIELNIIPVLQRILETNFNEKIQRCLLLTLRNFSDQMIHMENFDALISRLIKLLSSTVDRTIRHYIIDILSNLSCENQANKSLMIENNLIQFLIEILNEHNHSNDIIESTMCILRHLTGKCPLAHEAREYLRLSNAIPSLVKYLHTDANNWSLLKTCIGLLRNLAFSSENLILLCEYRIVYKIGQLFCQMKTIAERKEFFIMSLLVFTQRKERFQSVIFDQMIHSGCVEIIAQIALESNPRRIKHLSKMIVNQFHGSDTIEHRQIIQGIEKSIKIAQFL